MITQTVLEIKSDNLNYNLGYFRSLLRKETRVMVMVKAFGYGLGNPEISRLLERNGVDYLGVAFVQEGIDLRKAGINTPIMVMNPHPDQFELFTQYKLEPEIYSLRILGALDEYLRLQKVSMKIHLMFETGMQRLGLEQKDLAKTFEIIRNNTFIEVRGILSHLSSSEMEDEDDFTLSQIDAFEKFNKTFQEEFSFKVTRHILNTSGILFYPQFQYEMVRLGIGVYGVDRMENRVTPLKAVCTLKSIISQIKILKKGDTVGYGRAGIVKSDNTKIATVAMGYADGFYRSLGNGKYNVWINGQWAPTFGNICMDMFMIDITGLEVTEGEEVEIFGENQSVDKIAKAANTIPYEIFTSVGERVKRVII